MYQFNRILKMDLINLLINPMWWLGTLGLPLLLALIMGFITKGSYGTPITSYHYYCITMIVFGALNNATLAANSFMETRIMKANLRLCTAPVPSFYIYFSKVIATFLYGIFCHTLACIALWLITGVTFGGSQAIFLWLLLSAIHLFAASLGVMFCCLIKSEETVNQLLSNFITILCVLGGVFFPLKGLGQIINRISNFSPVTWINTAAFQAIYSSSLSQLGIVCAVLLGLAVLCTLISAKYFNQEDYL